MAGKRIGMTGKIGYFLFALLVLTTGTLCRQQLPVQYASGGDSVGSLTQHVPPQEKSGLHYFHHSFIASETVSEVIAPMLHINCRQLASATPSLRPSEKVRSLAAIVRRIPIPTRWITTSFRWAKSGFDRFDCPHAHLPTEEAHHSCLTEFARKNNSLQYMYFVLLMVVILTAIGLVAIALGVARAISPRSYNPQKGEAYECGIPTRGKSWMQFKVGYYLFAILFLMFDVETVFLFAWAVVVQEIGVFGLVSALFFLLILTFGLAYAWRKGALEWK